MRYRAAGGDAVVIAPLDLFVAVFHRASGITHLLAEPAPQIMAALTDAALDRDALMARLRAGYELAEADEAVLAARLDELVAAGLVTAA